MVVHVEEFAPTDLASARLQPHGEVYPSPLEWRDQVFYFLLPDRFSDGMEEELRTDASRRLRSWDNALYLVFRIVHRLSDHWRALNEGENLMALVLKRAVFLDGLR